MASARSADCFALSRSSFSLYSHAIRLSSSATSTGSSSFSKMACDDWKYDNAASCSPRLVSTLPIFFITRATSGLGLSSR